MTSTEFVKYLSIRGLNISERDLEFCDKHGLLRPVLRLKRPKSNDMGNPFCKYIYTDTDIFALQHYFSIGLIEFPHDGDFQPWTSYSKELEDIWLYYHPYQILLADQIYGMTRFVFKAEQLQDIPNPSSFIEHLQKEINDSVRMVKHLRIKKWTSWIGLLILLDEYYGRWVKTGVPFNIYDISPIHEYRTKLEDWARKFSPTRILMLSCLKIEQIEEFYKALSRHSLDIDPLSEWFIFQKLIKLRRRYNLKNHALRAQEYYGLLSMLENFIYDLTGKKMPEPDDVMDSQQGHWKSRIFGEPFDYGTKKTRNQILKYYLNERPLELVIIVEGETEEKIIELILQARAVDLEKDGFFIYNIKGQPNLENLKPLFRVSQLIDITIFAMMDDDKDIDKRLEKMKQAALSLGYEKEILVRKWNRDFETENFGIDTVLDKINQNLAERGHKSVDKSEVENRMKSTGEALIKVIENIIRKNNRDEEKQIRKNESISKPHLAELLIGDRLKEIQIEDDPDWDAKLPIEKELKRIFRLIPQYL